MPEKLKLKPFEIDCKRFYMPGTILRTICPKCSAKVKQDYGSDYLSYPDANEVFDLSLYCSKCEHEWKVKAILTVHLRILPEG